MCGRARATLGHDDVAAAAGTVRGLQRPRSSPPVLHSFPFSSLCRSPHYVGTLTPDLKTLRPMPYTRNRQP